MKQTGSFLLVLAAGFAGAWLIWHSRLPGALNPGTDVSVTQPAPGLPANPNPSEEPAQPPARKDGVLQSVQPLPNTPGGAKKASGVGAELTAPIKNNVIQFQVIDGMAVAYGDLILGKPDPTFQGKRGHAEAPAIQLWDKPEIPYSIHPDLPNPQRVETALEYLRSHTPLKFVPYSGQRDAIVFEPGSEHCLSALGRTGGAQGIKLSPGCGPQEIMHETLHALGFVHEQSRPDRDGYIEVVWENIEEKYHSQFAMVPESFLEAERGAPFDLHSVMMYRPDAFAVAPDQPTMKTRVKEPIVPTAQGLSEEDIRRIKRLYDFFEPRG
jgi:hypothetical protein